MTKSVWILCAALVAIVVSIEGGTITKRETSGVEHKRNSRMRYVAAYLLVLGGKTSPASGDIEKILSSVGIEADSEKLKKVLPELKGKSIDELIAQGREKLSSMPVGGGAAAAAAAPAAAAVEEKKEAKKEEKKEESEDEDEDMGFGLFD